MDVNKHIIIIPSYNCCCWLSWLDLTHLIISNHQHRNTTNPHSYFHNLLARILLGAVTVLFALPAIRNSMPGAPPIGNTTYRPPLYCFKGLPIVPYLSSYCHTFSPHFSSIFSHLLSVTQPVLPLPNCLKDYHLPIVILFLLTSHPSFHTYR